MLKKRIIPASILIVFISGLFYLDYYFKSTIGFTILLCLVAIGGLYEFYKMYENIGIKVPRIIPILYAVAALAALQVPYSYLRHLPIYESNILLVAVSGFLLTALAYYLFHIADFPRFFTLIMGFFYIFVPLYATAILYNDNRWVVISIIALVKISDSLAYFGGKAFGRHKLAPTISPNKTVEGFIAALVGGTIIGCFIFLQITGIIWLPAILSSFIIVVLAQSGDLLESLFKRHCQVKDSGKLLGGLGGILDLIDSLLLVYIFLLVIGNS